MASDKKYSLIPDKEPMRTFSIDQFSIYVIPRKVNFIAWPIITHDISCFYTLLGHLMIRSMIRSLYFPIGIHKCLKFLYSV